MIASSSSFSVVTAAPDAKMPSKANLWGTAKPRGIHGSVTHQLMAEYSPLLLFWQRVSQIEFTYTLHPACKVHGSDVRSFRM